MAADLQDMELMSKLGGTDMIASEAKYHRNCMRSFKNRYRSLLQKKSPNNSNEREQIAEARAFSELVTYMECSAENGVHIFKLSELHQLYVKRLETFDIIKTVNKTRLKNQLLGHFCENVKEQSDGRNVVLIFSDALQSLLKNALTSRDFQSEAFDFTSVAKTIRSEIFENDGINFNGAFANGCQIDGVPPNLLYFVSLLLNGSNIQEQPSDVSQACLTIAQMIVFNSKKMPKASGKTRHSKIREPPLPIYIGLNIHTQTRSRMLVDNLYQLGLSVSYDRVTEIINGLATSVCRQYKADNIVCPSNLRHGLYTVGALDNIDHNPSSTTSQGSFHGTGISVFQFPTEDEPGISRPTINLPNKDQANDFTLPDNYATVPVVNIKTSNITINTSNNNPREIKGNLVGAVEQENCWIEHSLPLLETNLVKGNYVSWSAYHASLVDSSKESPAISSLLPMFNEKAASVSMVKHGMDVLCNLTSYLNPGQVPVLTADQPLYAISKYVQWQWPTTYGENVFVTMLGGLHIEMALWSLCGDLLDCSGWTNALTDAGVASSGTSESFLKVSHLARTRHAHQVTVLALSKLQRDAFRLKNDDDMSFESWRTVMIRKSPTFQFWDIMIQLEIKCLVFVKAHRENKFDLFVEVLEELCPWFFALDHVNYSRWLPVFIQDMKALPEGIKNHLSKFWVIQKTGKKFSSIPIDQAHEQNNAIVKGSGGAVGLTENPEAFARWMVSGPEQARLLKEFEADLLNNNHDDNDGGSSYSHHEQGLSSQKAFQKQVQNLTVTISEMGNPFTDESPELIALDTRDCANESVVTTVRTIEAIGSEKYKEYVKNVLTDKKVPINDPIKKNSLPLFKRQQPKPRSKTSQELSALKNDCSLFSRLYIASQHRDGDLDDFFKHENQPYPPSLSQFGKIRFGKKSDLLKCLEVPSQPNPPTSYDAKIFDGAAIVHALLPGAVVTFLQYAEKVFLPFLTRELDSANRVDVVWDAYHPDSLKESTREKRGKGKRKKVGENTKLPRDWKNFLLDSSNKEELFALLSKRIGIFECQTEGKKIFITSAENVMSCGERVMQPCNHEEADTRIILHIVDALKNGAKSIFVRTVDTDVIVILAGHYYQLTSSYGPLDLWVGFGMGKHYLCYHVNSICEQLGERKANALPLFHAYTGCDTTSSFCGRGKKTAWEAWKSYPEATDAFLYMKENPFHAIEIMSPHFETLERLTVVMYDRSSSSSSTNESRRNLFTKQNRNLEHIPPTQEALLQHTRRALYQGGIWTTCFEAQQSLPSPEGYGWTMKESFKPLWSTLSDASKACSQLLRCGCKKGCNNRCKCVKSNLPCTELCCCSAGCTNVN